MGAYAASGHWIRAISTRGIQLKQSGVCVAGRCLKAGGARANGGAWRGTPQQASSDVVTS